MKRQDKQNGTKRQQRSGRQTGSTHGNAPTGALKERAGNRTIQRALQAATESTGTPLPLGARLHYEGLLGADLGGVRIHQNSVADDVARMLSTRALTYGENILSRDNLLDPTSQSGQDILAHELVHTVQQGPARLPTDGAPHLEQRNGRAEREAHNAGRQMRTGVRVSGQVAPRTARPAIARFDPQEEGILPGAIAPGARLGELDEETTAAVFVQVSELSTAISAEDADGVLRVLRRNTVPELHVIRESYGEDFFHDLNRVLAPARVSALIIGDRWGEARALLGDVLTLREEIRTLNGSLSTNRAGIFRVLQQLDDQAALDLFNPFSLSGGSFHLVIPGADVPSSNYKDTRLALKAAMGAGSDDYYRAVRIILRKAENARAAGNREAFPGLVDLSGPEGGGVVGDPILVARVNLMWDRIVRADRPGHFFSPQNMGPGHAFLSLTDLSASGRRMIAERIRNRDFESFDESTVARLLEIAEEPDDATALVAATDEALVERSHDALGMQIAMERGGELFGRARAVQQRADHGEGGETEADVDAARRIESMLLDPFFLERIVRRSADLFMVENTYVGWFRSLGVSESTLGVFRMRHASNYRELFEAVSAISPDARVTAVNSANGRAMFKALNITPDQRAVIDSLVYQTGNINLSELGPGLPEGETGEQLEVTGPPGGELARAGARQAATVAAQRMLFAIDARHPERMFGIIAQLTPLQREVLLETSTGQQLERRLRGGSFESYLHWTAVSEALEGNVSRALWRLSFDSRGRVEDEDFYEQYLLYTSRESRAENRRGFVLWHRLQQHPDIELSEEDRALVDRYARERTNIAREGDEERRTRLTDAMLGAPQVLGNPSLDPNVEAEYLHFRVHDRAGVREGVTAPWGWEGHDYDEAVTAFMLRYEQVRPGGVSTVELAELVLLYHDAMSTITAYGDANDRFAKDMASMVGCIVGVIVVSVLSGGTMTPFAVGALAAFAGGAAAAATGYAIRAESSAEDLLLDFGAGAIEGALAVVGQQLAARVVRGFSGAASTTVRAAGANAVRQTAASRSARLAESILDGMIGGAGGELFQTMRNEALWDQEISRILATLLVAVARGSSMGVAGGTVGFGIGEAIGSGWQAMSRRHGRESANDILRAFEMAELDPRSIAAMDDAAQDALFRARALHRAGQNDVAARVLTDSAGLDPQAAHRVLTSLRERTMMIQRAAGESGRVMDDAAAEGLSRELGVDIRLDGSLDGAEVLVDYRLGTWGDTRALSVRVSRAATVGDVLAHSVVLRRITQFERQARTFRGLVERIHAWVRGRSQMLPRHQELLGELHKHGLMLEARYAALASGRLDDAARAALERDIVEIQGWVRRFQDELQDVGAPQGVIGTYRGGQTLEELDFAEDTMRQRARDFDVDEWRGMDRDFDPDADRMFDASRAQQAAGANRDRFMSSLQLPRGMSDEEIFALLGVVGRGRELRRELDAYIAAGFLSDDMIRAEIQAAIGGNSITRARRFGPVAYRVRAWARETALSRVGADVQQMRDMLEALPPFAKGDFYEAWFERTGPAGIAQVPVGRDAVERLRSDRILDRVERIDGRPLGEAGEADVRRLFGGETNSVEIPELRIRELKGGSVHSDNIPQLRDNIRLLQDARIKEMVLQVSRPEALTAVAGDLRVMLAMPNFFIEISDLSGTNIRIGTAQQLNALLGLPP